MRIPSDAKACTVVPLEALNTSTSALWALVMVHFVRAPRERSESTVMAVRHASGEGRDIGVDLSVRVHVCL